MQTVEITGAERGGLSSQIWGQTESPTFARKFDTFLEGEVYSLTKGLLMGVPFCLSAAYLILFLYQLEDVKLL
jgi:hypothetical protein